MSGKKWQRAGSGELAPIQNGFGPAQVSLVQLLAGKVKRPNTYTFGFRPTILAFPAPVCSETFRVKAVHKIYQNLVYNHRTSFFEQTT